MMLKFIAFLMLVGTMGSIEFDRIDWSQAIVQFVLAGTFFVISEQERRIEELKNKLYN